MTFRMQFRTSRWDDWNEISPAGIGAGEFHFKPGYSHPAMLTWSCIAAQHSQPIPAGAWVKFWEDGATDQDGNPFSATNPLFLGKVEQPTPGADSRLVLYEAYDLTKAATREVTVFNTAYQPGEIPDSPPTAPEDGVPRLVYNVTIDLDPDRAFQVDAGGTVGMVIRGTLDFCYHPLYWLDAAPGDGTDLGNDVAYVDADLDALDTIPQEKLDFPSESPRGLIERLQRYDPRYRLLWDPSTKRWRIRNITTAPIITLTINDLNSNVLGLQLRPSTENCITALSIYGPPTATTQLFDYIDFFNDDPSTPESTPNGQLVPLGSGTIFETYVTATGTHYAIGYSQFQIAEPLDRQGAGQLPDFYSYNKTPLYVGQTLYPRVLISFDGGATLVEWDAAEVNTFQGIVTFTTIPFYEQKSESGQPIVAGSTQTIFLPNLIRLIYAPLEPPLKVRVPTTGYEGTAYTIAGLQVEQHRNDEALSIGREYGIPVTSTARRAQFTKLAQSILDQRKDIVWTGVVVLDGIDYRFCRLNRRIKFAVKDGSGGTLTTGWESIEAYVTDADYDFEEQTTTLTLSSDRMEAEGDDPEDMKRRLGIRALEARQQTNVSFQMQTFQSWAGNTISQVVGLIAATQTSYVDQASGEVHVAEV